MFWRRRRVEIVALPEPVAPAGLPVVAERIERAVVALAVHAQQLDGRLGRLEHRLDAIAELAADGPTHDDVVEVRVHSARVAAELARVTVELKAGIDQAARDAREAAKAAATPPPPSARDWRIHTVAEQIVALSDGFDTRPDDVRGHDHGGWAASA